MKSVKSDEAKRGFRKLLNDVEHQGEHITILRYKAPAAVIVPVEWYESAQHALGSLADSLTWTCEGCGGKLIGGRPPRCIGCRDDGINPLIREYGQTRLSTGEWAWDSTTAKGSRNGTQGQ